MQILQTIIGRIIFWISWPIIYFYLKDTVRNRVLVESNGEILLIKGWHNGFKWSLPGGGMHGTELPENSAIREVYEEVGIILELSKLISLSETEYRQNGLKFKILNYGYSLDKKQQTKKQPLEIISVEWFNVGDITPQMVDAQTWQCLIAWKQYSSQF